MRYFIKMQTEKHGDAEIEVPVKRITARVELDKATGELQFPPIKFPLLKCVISWDGAKDFDEIKVTWNNFHQIPHPSEPGAWKVEKLRKVHIIPTVKNGRKFPYGGDGQPDFITMAKWGTSWTAFKHGKFGPLHPYETVTEWEESGTGLLAALDMLNGRFGGPLGTEIFGHITAHELYEASLGHPDIHQQRKLEHLGQAGALNGDKSKHSNGKGKPPAVNIIGDVVQHDGKNYTKSAAVKLGLIPAA